MIFEEIVLLLVHFRIQVVQAAEGAVGGVVVILAIEGIRVVSRKGGEVGSCRRARHWDVELLGLKGVSRECLWDVLGREGRRCVKS